MYLESMSNSILTISFTFKFFKFVIFKVCGITTIKKVFKKTFAIVNETPFTEIDPLYIKNF